MNDKKQIEEIAQDIADICPDLVENCCGRKPCYVCIAEALVKDDYRKLPENAVVLSREQNEKWLDFLELNMNKARKETAKEILESLKQPPYIDFIESWVIDELAKRYDVEIKE